MLIPFSILWGGFALFWNASVWTTDAPLFFKLFGLPFLFVGLYITAGRFYHDAWRRSKTVYALTDQRAIIVTRTGSQKIRSMPVNANTAIEIEQGEGTSVYFGPRTTGMNQMNSIGVWSGASSDFAFERVADGSALLSSIDSLNQAR